MAVWTFYGRQEQLATLEAILNRKRWFFAKVTGRRRIGKTTLIQQAMHAIDPKAAPFWMGKMTTKEVAVEIERP